MSIQRQFLLTCLACCCGLLAETRLIAQQFDLAAPVFSSPSATPSRPSETYVQDAMRASLAQGAFTEPSTVYFVESQDPAQGAQKADSPKDSDKKDDKKDSDKKDSDKKDSDKKDSDKKDSDKKDSDKKDSDKKDSDKKDSDKKDSDKKDDKKDSEKKDEKKEKKWYEKYTLRGYTQLRFNQELFSRGGSAPPQHVGDRSISEDQSFLIRRARLIFASEINDYAALYFQPDFAVTPPGSPDQNHFAQLRDLYADLYLDTEKEYRFRVGNPRFRMVGRTCNRVPIAFRWIEPMV